MRKSSLLLFFLFFSSLALQAQNLVPNPSFEDTVACPTLLTQIDRAMGWSSYRITPDYFNSCSSPSSFPSVSVPSNQWGFQYARTGEAYAGLITFSLGTSDAREYMGIQLSQPLIIGQNYYVSFYVTRAISPTPYINVASNKIGLRLSTAPFSSSNPEPIANYAHVYSDSVITDTLNWVNISGSFVADSAYQFLSLGNFFYDSLTAYIAFDSSSTVAYYYIDDIYLSTDSPKGIPSIKNWNIIQIFPNPASEWVTVIAKDICKFSLYDFCGKLCLSNEVLPASYVKFDISDLSRGIYFINIETTNKNITRKLIINEF